jgi:hypothetical protein
MTLHQGVIDAALQQAHDRGLLTDDGFREQLRALAIRPDNVVPYKGRVREVLDAKAGGARRRGMTVEFVQAYQHGKLVRCVLILDPSLPDTVCRQVVLVTGAETWDAALVRAGILIGDRPRSQPPTAYIECPMCSESGSSDVCPLCHGKGLVPSSDDS